MNIVVHDNIASSIPKKPCVDRSFIKTSNTVLGTAVIDGCLLTNQNGAALFM